MSSQASLFVVVFTLVNILACVWLMWWTARSRIAQPPKAQGQEPEKTGHVWDDDLEEFNNPLPRWWLWLFIITVIFGLLYLAIYPGLGNFAGTLGWSQQAQYEQQMAAQRAKFEQHVARLKDKSLSELTHDPDAMSTAKNLFGQNCSTCHGSDARGAKGFPNLADKDWLWGDAEDTVLASIAQGRMGMMPAWGDALGAQGVEEVAAYVFSLNDSGAPAALVAAGKERFAAMCSACHGPDAKGNPLLGAPNLADDIWLYGGDLETIEESIAKGRQNQMPAHLDTLGETRVRLLAAYVLSLGGAPLRDGTAPARATAQTQEIAAQPLATAPAATGPQPAT